jgi:hypothetical protein
LELQSENKAIIMMVDSDQDEKKIIYIRKRIVAQNWQAPTTVFPSQCLAVVQA